MIGLYIASSVDQYVYLFIISFNILLKAKLKATRCQVQHVQIDGSIQKHK